LNNSILALVRFIALIVRLHVSLFEGRTRLQDQRSVLTDEFRLFNEKRRNSLNKWVLDGVRVEIFVKKTTFKYSIEGK